MGLFSRFEDRAENIIEGSGKNGGIEPVKLAKRACKEMEREKMVGVGHEYAPTLYNILLSTDDDAKMSGYYPSLAGEIATYLISYAEKHSLVFDCKPLVRFIIDDGLKKGRFDIIAESVSPAIIEELRHEEMVHYGLEQDFSEPHVENDPLEPLSEHDYHEPAPAAVPASTPAPVQYPEQNHVAAPFSEPEPVDAYTPRAYHEHSYDDAESLNQAVPPADATVMLEQPVAKQPSGKLVNLVTHEQHTIFSDRTTMGRENSCNLIVPDPSVSRHHAEILLGENGWLIRDTGSTNGTAVNGEPVSQSRIYSGDIITLGNTQIKFQED